MLKAWTLYFSKWWEGKKKNPRIFSKEKSKDSGISDVNDRERRLNGNSMIWVQGPRNLRKLLHTISSRKQEPFGDQNSEFIWNALNLHVTHNSIQSKLWLVKKKSTGRRHAGHEG